MATANANDLSSWGLGLTAVGLLVVGGALMASVAGSLAIYQTTLVGGGVSNETIALVVGGMAGGTILTTIGLLLLAA